MQLGKVECQELLVLGGRLEDGELKHDARLSARGHKANLSPLGKGVGTLSQWTGKAVLKSLHVEIDDIISRLVTSLDASLFL